MAEHDRRRYLVIVQLANDSTLQRVAQDAPKILDVLNQLSGGDCVSAFRSNDGLLFGMFIHTNAPGAVIRAEFEKSPGTRNGDNMMGFDVGDNRAGTTGFSRAWTWLQRH